MPMAVASFPASERGKVLGIYVRLSFPSLTFTVIAAWVKHVTLPASPTRATSLSNAGMSCAGRPNSAPLRRRTHSPWVSRKSTQHALYQVEWQPIAIEPGVIASNRNPKVCRRSREAGGGRSAIHINLLHNSLL